MDQKISHEQFRKSGFEIASISEPWRIIINNQSLDLGGYRQNSVDSAAIAYCESTITDEKKNIIYDFLIKGGIIVKTEMLSDPESTYRVLANSKDQDSIISVNGHVAQISSTENSMPAILYVYPGDNRQISVWAYVSDKDIIKIGKKLDIVVQGYLPVDLDKYQSDAANQ